MKKFLLIIFSIILIANILIFPVSAAEEVKVYVNGKLLATDQPALIVNGRTLVPLRAISEALNCMVLWEEAQQTAHIYNESATIAVKIGTNSVTKINKKNTTEEEIIAIDVPAAIYSGRVLVPARAIAEALYADVSWNEAGKYVDINLEYDYISRFNENNLAEVKKHGKYGYIAINRQVVVPVIYDAIGGFSDNLAIARKGDKWGCVDITGKEVVPFVYDIMWKFSDGFAVVGKNKKYGYINIAGKEIVPAVYDLADNFSEGMARVMQGNKWGYVNTEGRLVIPLIYDKADSFYNGEASVEKDGTVFYINKTGNSVN